MSVKKYASADHPIHLVLGLSIWSIWFIAMYGGLSVFCSFENPPRIASLMHPINLGLLALTAITCAALVALSLWSWRNGKSFPGRISSWLYIASTIATLSVALPVFFLPPCL